MHTDIPTPVLSVIVPVYQAGDYLRRLVDSTGIEELSMVELILVDDGSTDDSPQICDEYAAHYSNVRVVHKANGGVSTARNIGLQAAVGRYIMFADADDSYVPHALRYLAPKCGEADWDLYVFGIQYITEDGTIDFLPPYAGLHQVSVLKQDFQKTIYWTGANSTVNKIFKRDLIDKYGIDFAPIRIAEDAVFVLNYMQHCAAVYYDSTVLYHYYKNAGSAIQRYSGDRFENDQYFITVLEALLQQWQVSTDTAAYATAFAYKNAIIAEMCDLLWPDCPFSDREKARRLNGLSAQYTKERRWRSILASHLSGTERIQLLCIRYKLSGLLFKAIRLKRYIVAQGNQSV